VIGSLHLGSALTAAFLASLVEAVEALTIVLAVAMIRGWRPAGLGGLASLALIVIVLVRCWIASRSIYCNSPLGCSECVGCARQFYALRA